MIFGRLKAALAVAAMAIMSSTALAKDLTDAEIIGIYSQVNSFDIETALIGEAMGQSDEVRALGKMVSSDHSGVRAGVHQISADLGLLPVLPPSRIDAAMDHDRAVAALRAASPEEFDALYLQHEIAFHRAAIIAVRELLLPAADAQELKAHFEAVLPAFEHHLQANIEAAKALGVAAPD